MFYIQIEEIKDNRVLTKLDVQRITFHIRQTFERYTELVLNGYLSAESKFNDPNGDNLDAKPFYPDVERDQNYIDCNLGKNLEVMRQFCFETEQPKRFLKDMGVTDGYTSGGLNDFLYETLPPCLAFEGLIRSGVMEVQCRIEHVHWLLIHFFARLKLEYGSLSYGNVPDLDMVTEQIEALGIHESYFSFRELTLLGGYKTERAVRNLASPSTPEHRRLPIIKKGRSTFVKHEVVSAWLKDATLD